MSGQRGVVEERPRHLGRRVLSAQLYFAPSLPVRPARCSRVPINTGQTGNLDNFLKAWCPSTARCLRASLDILLVWLVGFLNNKAWRNGHIITLIKWMIAAQRTITALPFGSPAVLCVFLMSARWLEKTGDVPPSPHTPPPSSSRSPPHPPFLSSLLPRNTSVSHCCTTTHRSPRWLLLQCWK